MAPRRPEWSPRLGVRALDRVMRLGHADSVRRALRGCSQLADQAVHTRRTAKQTRGLWKVSDAALGDPALEPGRTRSGGAHPSGGRRAGGQPSQGQVCPDSQTRSRGPARQHIRPVNCKIAAQRGVSRPTAQRYVGDMAADGRVEITLRYGATGRPEHRFSWRCPDLGRVHGRGV